MPGGGSGGGSGGGEDEARTRRELKSDEKNDSKRRRWETKKQRYNNVLHTPERGELLRPLEIDPAFEVVDEF